MPARPRAVLRTIFEAMEQKDRAARHSARETGTAAAKLEAKRERILEQRTDGQSTNGGYRPGPWASR
jgi:hypothetical protein